MAFKARVPVVQLVIVARQFPLVVAGEAAVELVRGHQFPPKKMQSAHCLAPLEVWAAAKPTRRATTARYFIKSRIGLKFNIIKVIICHLKYLIK